ncbi:uncharacterized protein BXZ73DRAFT_100581 [Epithele typhae]|uniref:uncharacterized protein n=1 Tax=Epithele typhae TaxID=378194 RepID=UPI0020085C8C|nr:uncharacterized protein BXZ73DRAFT_100581 [Epithele typhae]KAH9935195.1 hypothetical protein BXZ73DRAFT_100581 [Epithele typhae]
MRRLASPRLRGIPAVVRLEHVAWTAWMCRERRALQATGWHLRGSSKRVSPFLRACTRDVNGKLKVFIVVVCVQAVCVSTLYLCIAAFTVWYLPLWYPQDTWSVPDPRLRLRPLRADWQSDMIFFDYEGFTFTVINPSAVESLPGLIVSDPHLNLTPRDLRKAVWATNRAPELAYMLKKIRKESPILAGVSSSLLPIVNTTNGYMLQPNVINDWRILEACLLHTHQ